MSANPLATALYSLKQAAELAGLDPKVVELLSVPKRTMEFTFPMRMDNGDVRIISAYRVHWCDALGGFKDGTRFTENLTLDELKALALWMTIKHAVGGIPAGGGKGGVVINPEELSEWELERLSRNFIRHLPMKGAWVDVQGADIGTSDKTQGWMLDEYETIMGYHSPAAINDKPTAVSGTVGTTEATGLGVYYVFEQAVQDYGFGSGCTAVVQGFGKVGSVLAGLLSENGYKVKAVSDVYGAIYSAEGIDCRKLGSYVEETGSVVDFPGTEAITNQELLEMDVDVLVPAAVQSVITEENASRIKAGLVIEAANGPVTPEAEEILKGNGVPVIPDVVANVGGAIVCHFERIQGLTDEYWDLDRVRNRLKEWMTAAYQNMSTRARENSISPRMAAWVNALKKIEASVKKRGWA